MSVFTNAISEAEEEAVDYIAAVLKLVADKNPLDVLESQASKLEGLIAGMSEETLRRPEAPGKWSILEVIHHLVDSELVWAYRLRLVAAEERPTITGYDQDAWAKGLKYRQANVPDLLELIRVLRKYNLNLIRSLNEDELQRAGVHSERGEETIEHMIRLYAGHDLVHLQQLKRIAASF